MSEGDTRGRFGFGIAYRFHWVSLLKQKGPAFAGPLLCRLSLLSRHSFLLDLEAVFLESLQLFAFTRQDAEAYPRLLDQLAEGA